MRWPDAPARNRLVVAGGYTYGLYLLHFPAMILAFQVMKRSEMLSGTWIGVGLAGCFAISSGLAFGWLELRLYDRLKRAFDSLSRFTSCWTARLTRIGLDRPSIHPVRRGDTRR